MSAVATAPAKRLMTADEFLAFCERPENDNRKFELVRGEVIEVSLPSKMHGIVASNISFFLRFFANQIGPGYPVAGDSGVMLERDPDTVRGPDVAYFIDEDRFDDVGTGWAETSPVLAVEVRSPNDKERDVMEKVEEYLAAGVKVVWVVNYEEKFVLVYRPKKQFELIKEGQVLTVAELPGFSCTVADIFKLPRELQSPVPPAP